LKFKADFHSKMGVCRHELGGGSTPTPRQFQPLEWVVIGIGMTSWITSFISTNSRDNTLFLFPVFLTPLFPIPLVYSHSHSHYEPHGYSHCYDIHTGGGCSISL